MASSAASSEAVLLLRLKLIEVHTQSCPNTSNHSIADCPHLHSNWSVDPLNTPILKAGSLPSSFSGNQPSHFSPSPATTFSRPAEKQSASFSHTAPPSTFSSPVGPQPSGLSQQIPATFSSPAGNPPFSFSSPVASASSPFGNAHSPVFSSPVGPPAAFSFASPDKSAVKSPSVNLFNSPFTSAPASNSPFVTPPSQTAPSSNSATPQSNATKGGFSNKNSRSKRRSNVESAAVPTATQPESQPPQQPQVQPQVQPPVQPQQPQVQSKQPQTQPELQPQPSQAQTQQYVIDESMTLQDFFAKLSGRSPQVQSKQPEAQPPAQPEVKPQPSQAQPQQPQYVDPMKLKESWAKAKDPSQFVGAPLNSWQEFASAVKDVHSQPPVRVKVSARNDRGNSQAQSSNVPGFVNKSHAKKSGKSTSSDEKAPLNSNSQAAPSAATPAAAPRQPNRNALPASDSDSDYESDYDVEVPLEVNVKAPTANVAKDRVFVRRRAQASVPTPPSSKPATASAVPEVPKADTKTTPTPAPSKPQGTQDASASKSESKAEATPTRSNVYSDGPSVHFKERNDPSSSSSASRPHSAAAPSKPAQAATPTKAAAPSPGPVPASKAASPSQSRPATASKPAPPRKSTNPKSHEALHEYYSALSMSELQAHIRKFTVDVSTVFEKADIVALVCTAHRVHEEKVAAEKAAREAEAAAMRIVKNVANWAKRLSLPAMLNELNGAQPGNDMFVPEPVKAKARSRFGRANNFYGGGGYDYFDYEDYQEPVTVNFELIRKSYKRALLATHPDKHMHESEEKQLQATERFKALNEAFKKYESEHGR